MARLSFTDMSSDDLYSSDESIFSDASDSEKEIFQGKIKSWFFFENQTQFYEKFSEKFCFATLEQRLLKEKMVKMMND